MTARLVLRLALCAGVAFVPDRLRAIDALASDHDPPDRDASPRANPHRFESSKPACGVGLVSMPRDSGGPSVRPSFAGLSGIDVLPTTETVVDILVVYTTMAKDGAGGSEAIGAVIDDMFRDANSALTNSQTNVRLRLVYAGEVSYGESGSMPTDMDRLRLPADGYLDEVHALRNAYGADLVCLLTHTGDYLAYAYITSTDETAYSVVGWGSAAAPSYLFAHEIGHNLGAGHARPIGPRGKYSFSYGYYGQGDPSEWRTIVASYGGALIPYFSTPNLLYDGQPIGVDKSDPVHSADNARTIALHAPIVAAFRAAVVEVPAVEHPRLPGPCRLLAIRPNPFRQSTVIPYELRGQEPVRLTILDIRGRHIQDLADAVQSPGGHAAVWDGRMESGGYVPSGLYLCRIEVAGHVESRCIVLLK